MPYVNLPGVDLWYEDTGGDGSPVVFCPRRLGNLRLLDLPDTRFYSGQLPLHHLRPAHLGKVSQYRRSPATRLPGRGFARSGRASALGPIPPGRYGRRRDHRHRVRPGPSRAGAEPGVRQHHRRHPGPRVPGSAGPHPARRKSATCPSNSTNSDRLTGAPTPTARPAGWKSSTPVDPTAACQPNRCASPPPTPGWPPCACRRWRWPASPTWCPRRR